MLDEKLSMAARDHAQLTDRLAAHDAELAAADEELAAVREATLDCVIGMDSEGLITSINSAALATFGIDPTMAVGHPLAEVVLSNKSRDLCRGAVAGYVRSGADSRIGRRMEVSALRGDGTEFLAELAIMPLRAGDTTRFLAHMRDISGRKHAEEELRKSEAALDEAQRIAEVGSWQWNIEINRTTWSETQYRLFGLRPEHYPGTYAAFMSLVHPEDRSAVKAAVEKTLSERTPYSVEYRIVRPDGSVRFIYSQGELFLGDNGAPREMIGTCQDITTRKLVERRLTAQHAVTRALAECATLAEAAPRLVQSICENTQWTTGALWMIEPTDQTMRCLGLFGPPGNRMEEFQAMTRQAALQRGQEIPGRVWLGDAPVWMADATTTDGRARDQAAHRAELRGACGFPLRVNGKVVGALEFFSHDLGDPDPEVLRMFAVISSQIEQFIHRRSAEAECRQKEKIEQERNLLQEAVSAMEHVLAVVGHELRTPLAGLRAMSEFLLNVQARQTAEFDTFIKSIHDETVRMADTVNSLLEAARLNSGRAKWNWSRFPIADAARDAIDTVRPLIDASHIELALEMESPQLEMMGDADAVRRLLINLLSNSAKHTAEGQIQVRISPAEDQHVRIEVRDTGDGIPQEIIARLGEAFALNQGIVGTNQIGGTGLGLAICKGILRAHGGTFSVESSTGIGTTVTAILRADLQGPVLALNQRQATQIEPGVPV